MLIHSFIHCTNMQTFIPQTHARIANYGPWAKCDFLSVFINHVLLKHRHIHSLVYYLELSSYNDRVQ